MKIVIRLKAIPQTSEIDIHLDELGLTPDEWEALDREKKEEIIDEYVTAEDENNSPYLQAESFHLSE